MSDEKLSHWRVIYNLRWLVLPMAFIVAAGFGEYTTRLYVRESLFIGECFAISLIASLLLWNRYALPGWLVSLQGLLIPAGFVLLAQDRYSGGIDDTHELFYNTFFALMTGHGLLLLASIFIRWRAR